MAVITKQELEDAAVDAQTLEDVANGSATLNGNGQVVSRLGQSVKTVAKVIADLAATDVGAAAAAAINLKLNARDTYADTAAFVAGTSDGEYGYVGTALYVNAAGVATAATADEAARLWVDILTLEINTGENLSYIETLFAAVLGEDRLAPDSDVVPLSNGVVDYAGQPTGGWSSASDTWYEWVVGFVPDKPEVATAVQVFVDNITNVKNIRYRFFRRKLSSTFTGGPSVANGDELLYENVFSTINLPQVADANYVQANLPLPRITLTENYVYMCAIEGRANDGTTPVSMGFRSRTNDPAPAENAIQARRGYYSRTTVAGDYTNYGGAGAWSRLWAALIAEAGGVRNNSVRRATAMLGDLDEVATTRREMKNTNAGAYNGMFNADCTVWYIPIVTAEPGYVDFIRTYLLHKYLDGETLTMRLYHYQDDSGASPGTIAGLTPVYTYSAPVAGVIGASDQTTLVDLPAGGFFFPTGSRLMAAVEITDTSGDRVAINIAARAYEEGVEEGYLKGGFAIPGDVYHTWRNPSTGNCPYGELVTKEAANATLDKLAGIATEFTETEVARVSRPLTGGTWGAVQGFDGWAVGVSPDAPMYPSAIGIMLESINNAANLKLECFRRLSTVGDGNGVGVAGAQAPGVNVGDVLIKTYDYVIASDVEANPLSADTQEVKMPLDNFGPMTPEYIYMFRVTATDDLDAPVNFGAGQHKYVDAEPDWRRGWYSLDTNPNYSTVSAAGPNGVAYVLYGKAWTIGASAAVSTEERGLIETTVEENALDQVQGAYTVSIPQVTIQRPSGDLDVASTEVSIDPPASTVMQEVRNLIYASGPGSLPGQELEYQYVTGITITRNSDSAVLVEGVDWAYKFNTGRFYGVQNIANVSVTVDYTGHDHRYDLIVCHPATGVVSVVKGTDRAIDPEEYMPVAPDGRIVLFKAYVTKDGVELLPVHRYRPHGVRVGKEALYADMMEYNRWALGKTLGKLRSGTNIRLIGYGDSITQQGHEGGDNALDYYYVPNHGRDFINFYARIPDDTKALVPQYDNTDPDFSDALVAGHVKTGFNWHLKAEIEKRWGVSVEYRNWGIGGTTSFNTAPDGKPNGTYPDRLNAMLGDNGDLMVLAFGMNELGASWTYDQCRLIIESFQAAGGEVIVLTTPQINQWGGRATQDTWRYTNDELVRCAVDTNSAYLSLELLEGEGNEGAIGLSRQNSSNSNLYNHQGFYQLRQIGLAMGRIFA